MSKQKGYSRKKKERKGQKCHIRKVEKLQDLDDEIVLTDEELQQVQLEFSSDEGSPPFYGLPEQFLGASLSSSSDSDNGISVPPTRASFLTFLRNVSTSKWNLKDNARQVFRHFRITPYIVHPEHFISKFSDYDIEKYRISNILTNFNVKEEQMGVVPWSKVKESVEELLILYECEGLEELANIYWDKRQSDHARQLLDAFSDRITALKPSRVGKSIHHQLLSILEEMTPGRDFEDIFENYVRLLIGFIDLPYFERSVKKLTLDFPEYKEFTKFGRGVFPDFLLITSVRPRRIILVGEIKTAGSHGLSDETYPGTEAETSYSDGEKTLVKDEEPDHADAVTENKVEDEEPDHADAVTENKMEDEEPDHADAVTENKVEDEEPDHADAVTENKVEDEEPDHADAVTENKKKVKDGEKIDDTLRYLDKAEKYKVSCYLPQLLAQMMAAMQKNPVELMQHPMSESENYQLGFAVEGFKLRFIKLVVRDYLGRFSDEQPFVNELLKGKPFKCDVYMTRELNLLKGRHVEMFFKMLVAIGHHDARNDI